VTRVDPKLPKSLLMTTSSSTPSPKKSEKLLYRGKWGYDADAMGGLPVGIQPVCKNEMTKVVDAALGERGFGPDGWERWT